jgi:hypothetical protein
MRMLWKGSVAILVTHTTPVTTLRVRQSWTHRSAIPAAATSSHTSATWSASWRQLVWASTRPTARLRYFRVLQHCPLNRPCALECADPLPNMPLSKRVSILAQACWRRAQSWWPSRVRMSAQRSQPALADPTWTGDLGPRLRGDDAGARSCDFRGRHSRVGGNPVHREASGRSQLEGTAQYPGCLEPSSFHLLVSSGTLLRVPAHSLRARQVGELCLAESAARFGVAAPLRRAGKLNARIFAFRVPAADKSALWNRQICNVAVSCSQR